MTFKTACYLLWLLNLAFGSANISVVLFRNGDAVNVIVGVGNLVCALICFRGWRSRP